MAGARQATPTKADLEDQLDQIAAKAEEGLDPELTREQVVLVLKEISDIASGDGDADDDDEEDDEEEDDDQQ